jgi:2-C-methyl-D-erythritol 4-phosphate cytidylyltransferase
MSERPRYWAVIPAAGVGRRMGSTLPKQYLPLANRTVIECTLQRFFEAPQISGVVVALAADDPYWPSLELHPPKPLLTAPGGAERSDSVRNALDVLSIQADPDDWVLVHDAARPCLSCLDLQRLMDAVAEDPVGGILAAPVRDTLKRDDGDGRIQATEERAGLWHALTPQMFRLGLLRAALERVVAEGARVTDEAGAVERLGARPRLVEGRMDNIKITHPEDLLLAERLLEGQEAVQGIAALSAGGAAQGSGSV